MFYKHNKNSYRIFPCCLEMERGYDRFRLFHLFSIDISDETIEGLLCLHEITS